jgi:hypothetical protein
MATSKARNSSPIRNNSSTLLHGGSVDRAEIGSLDFGSTNMNVVTQPNISGLTTKAISSGDFNVDNKLVAMGLNQSIAGVAISVIKSSSGMASKTRNVSVGYTQSDITAFDLLSGLPTFGENAGLYIQNSGLDGKMAKEADLAANSTMAVPGRLVYQFGSNTPKEQSYSPRTG